MIGIDFYIFKQCPILNQIRVIELEFIWACSRGGRRATSTDRGSVLKDRLTLANAHTKVVYKVSSRQKGTA
jgi:hypothetical protein